jgi:plastocyanin
MTPRGDATDLSRRGFLRATAAGATVAAATGSATAQDEEESGGGSETVTVGPGGDFSFEPGTDDPLYVEPGTTVTFVWDSNTHNIVVDSQPDDAEWEGHETIEDEGFEYEHTFEVEGTYDYYCEPHRQSGMEATIEVTSDPPEENAAPAGPQIPPPARTMGIVATATMVSTLGVAYFFMKYGDD